MLIAGVLCVCAAVATAAFGAWSLAHGRATDANQLALRAMGPTQLAAAVMLGAGGIVALTASPRTALVLVIVSVAGALGTLTAGSWQSARFVLRRQTSAAGDSEESGCGGDCAACLQPCD